MRFGKKETQSDGKGCVSRRKKKGGGGCQRTKEKQTDKEIKKLRG